MKKEQDDASIRLLASDGFKRTADRTCGFLQIEIGPDEISELHEHPTTFMLQAKSLHGILKRGLPGGTLDALLRVMLEHRASGLFVKTLEHSFVAAAPPEGKDLKPFVMGPGLDQHFLSRGDPWNPRVAGFGLWTEGEVLGKTTAIVSCPECGKASSLSEHRIAIDGKVKPSLVCPFQCGFHAYVTLREWEEPRN